MSWQNIIKNEEEMKNKFFEVIRRQYKDMGWAEADEDGYPTLYREDGYDEYLIEAYQEEFDEGLSVVDAIINEIQENEIVMNSIKKDDPERAKYIQNFINELKALMA